MRDQRCRTNIDRRHARIHAGSAAVFRRTGSSRRISSLLCRKRFSYLTKVPVRGQGGQLSPIPNLIAARSWNFLIKRTEARKRCATCQKLVTEKAARKRAASVDLLETTAAPKT